MGESTKRILIRRRTKEVITVKASQQAVFVCNICHQEQTFSSLETSSIPETTEMKMLNGKDGETEQE